MGWIACGKLHRGSTKGFSLGHASALGKRGGRETPPLIPSKAVYNPSRTTHSNCAAFFVKQAAAEALTALPGRRQCECLSRRPFKTYPTDVGRAPRLKGRGFFSRIAKVHEHAVAHVLRYEGVNP